MTWHVDTDLLVRYARASEAVDGPSAASVEAHLIRCAECRDVVAGAAVPAEVEASWAMVADAIDRPPEPLVARVLGLVGVPSESVRLVAATRELALGWFLAVVGCAAVAVFLAHETDSPAPFLAVAPLVPVFVVWLVFTPLADPAGEAGVATPLAGAGLLVRRLLAVELPAVFALALASLLVPGGWLGAMAWLLPGLALGACAVALATSVRVVTAATVVTAAWSAVLAAVALTDRVPTLAEAIVFRPSGQTLAGAVGLGAVALCWYRRDRFATLEVTW